VTSKNATSERGGRGARGEKRGKKRQRDDKKRKKGRKGNEDGQMKKGNKSPNAFAKTIDALSLLR